MLWKSEVFDAPAAHEVRSLLVLLDVVKGCQNKKKKTLKWSKGVEFLVTSSIYCQYHIRRHWEELLNKKNSRNQT